MDSLVNQNTQNPSDGIRRCVLCRYARHLELFDYSFWVTQSAGSYADDNIGGRHQIRIFVL